jgi:aminopeptidase N
MFWRPEIGLLLLASACGGSQAAGVASASHAAAPTPAVDLALPPRDDGRLPPGVRPTRYALDLDIDPSHETLTGRARIGVILAEGARAVVLHGRDLAVKAVVAETSGGRITGTARSRLAFGAKDGPDELVLAFERDLPRGEVTLDLAYEAPFSEEQHGVFRVEEGGAKYAFTNFEPTDARRMFPCFDEPVHKTPYRITLRVPQGNVAFTNTSEVRRSDDPIAHRTTFEFEPTQPLPTYLVALAVGPLEVLEGQKSPVPLRVIAAKGKAGLGRVALDVAAAHLERFAQYFDQPYPYGKLDLVAVPNFHGDGMENAGLITSREEILLIEEKSAPPGARRALDDTIAHEVAHHWFGNMVTMQWWDELWLKESFAQWVGTKIVGEWKPETKAGLEQVNRKAWGMLLDALPTARPIRTRVRTATEIVDYNPLVFEKGAPVIGMMEAWLGADAFRDGLRRYMKKHRGGSVTSNDFYASLSEASAGRDVAKVMESFVAQSGVPVVSAELDCTSASPSGPLKGTALPFLRLRQEEYRYLDRQETSAKTWRIPVCVRFDTGDALATQCTLLDDKEGRLELLPNEGRPSTCPSFVYPNAGEVGYYRFRLPRADLEKLAGRSLGKLTESERLGLAANAWSEVWSGHLPLSAYLGLLPGYRDESSHVVLEQILDALVTTDRAVVSEASRPAFARYVRSVFGASARRLGWTPKKGESEETKLTRTEVLFAIGVLGQDPAVLNEAKRVANAWFLDPAGADHELAGLAIGLAAKRDEAAMFERLLSVLKSDPTPQVRQRVRRGLTVFDTPRLVERALDLTLDGTLQTQELRDVLLAFVRRRPTVEIAFAWAQKHFDEVAKASPHFGPLVLARVPSSLCNAERVRAVEAFLLPRLEKLGGVGDLRDAVDIGLRCSALAGKEAAPTRSWLAARGGAQRLGD